MPRVVWDWGMSLNWRFRLQFVFTVSVLGIGMITWYSRPFLISGVYSGKIFDWTTAQEFSPINDFKSMRNNVTPHGRAGSKRTFPIIDILSTGSFTRPDHQFAQEAFFREHPSVRSFFKATEIHDTEVDCHTHLNLTQLALISKLCRSWKGKTEAPVLTHLIHGYATMRYLQKKANPLGWMCAQKRPLTALWQILQTYPNSDDFPDYLFMVDDDTWINMDRMVPTLTLQYPSQQPFLIAGCRVDSSYEQFFFPYGGFGTIITKAALQRWIKPLTGCNPFSWESSHIFHENASINSNDFVRYTCDRYHNHHGVGERIPADLFSKQEVTVADILYAYVQRANYTDVENWDGIGFCLHSDWALGYFAAEYNITLDGPLQAYENSTIDRYGSTGECQNGNVELCHPNATICHYMTPYGMIQRMKSATTPRLQKILSADVW